MAKLISRISELETRVGDPEKFSRLRDQIEAKRQELEHAVAAQIREHDQYLAGMRNAEVTRLRADITSLCGGMGIKTIEAAPAEERSQQPRSAGRQDLGVTGGASSQGSPAPSALHQPVDVMPLVPDLYGMPPMPNVQGLPPMPNVPGASAPELDKGRDHVPPVN